MCLRIAVENPDHVLLEGTHAGFHWIILFNHSAYRCGYVRVPPGHPWHGKEYEQVSAGVHGGLTFSDPAVPCEKDGPDDGWWFGFDCAHGCDAPDPSLPGYRPPTELETLIYKDLGREVRDNDYVEVECRTLCEQAANAAKKE